MNSQRIRDQDVTAAAAPRESQRSATEIIVSAVAGAIANPVVADAYEGIKDGVKAGWEKLHPEADAEVASKNEDQHDAEG